MASPSWDSSCSQSSPVSVFNSATCCFRVCKSHPTRIMSQPSVGVTSWYSPRPRLPATSGCSHDISKWTAAPPSSSPVLADADALRRAPGGEPADRPRHLFTEHERCGDLDGGVEGPIVWMACDCGA